MTLNLQSIIIKIVFVALCFMPGYLLADLSSSVRPLKLVYTSTDPVFIEAIREFDSEGVQFEWMDQSDLNSRVLENEDPRELPEIIIASSDLLGLHKQAAMSQVSAEQFATYLGRSSESFNHAKSGDGQIYGLPLVNGNHLILYYNWDYVSSVAGSWHELLGQRYSIDSGVDLVGWSVLDMYWLIPFVSAFGELPVRNQQVEFDVESIGQALEFVWSLIDKGVVDIQCNYQCNLEKFTSGQLAYHINGVWEYSKLKKVLGDKLGISHLPEVQGKLMKSYYAETYIMFPNDSLNGQYREEIKHFIQYTKSKKYQDILRLSMSNFAVVSTEKNKTYDNEPEDRKVIRFALRESQPMPHLENMFLVWEALLKGFVRFGGGSMEAYEASSYMQRYVEANE